jgi:hypothetical protein
MRTGREPSTSERGRDEKRGRNAGRARRVQQTALPDNVRGLVDWLVSEEVERWLRRREQ